MRRVRKREDGCWVWLGGKTKSGYARLAWPMWRDRYWRVSRLVVTLLRGPIPDGLLVCHSCDNPECVNPGHLWLGTDRENLADRNTKGRGTFGARNGRSKLTEGDVVRLRAMRAQGVSWPKLAKAFGISTFAASAAARGVTWKHISNTPQETTTAGA